MTTKKILSNDEKNTLGYGRNVTVERLERDKKNLFYSPGVLVIFNYKGEVRI